MCPAKRKRSPSPTPSNNERPEDDSLMQTGETSSPPSNPLAGENPTTTSPPKREPSPSPRLDAIETAVNSLLQTRKISGFENMSALLPPQIIKELSAYENLSDHLPKHIIQDPFFYIAFNFKDLYNKPYLIDKPYPIRLPHSLLSQPPKLGLIINDTITDDEELSIMHVAHGKIQSLNIPVTHVLFSKLKADHLSTTLSFKPTLFDEFDILFADRGLIPLLDDMFRHRDNLPVWLDLINNGDWKGQFQSACCSTWLRLMYSDCSYDMKVGRISMNMQFRNSKE